MQGGDPSWRISEDPYVMQTSSYIIANTDAYKCAGKLDLVVPENAMHNQAIISISDIQEEQVKLF